MQRLNLDIENLNSMEFNFNYDGNDGLSNGFKTFLMNTESLLFVIVKPIGKINPRNKAREIHTKLINLLSRLGLEDKSRKVWLDYINIYGIEHPYIYEWQFETINAEVLEKIEVVDYTVLSEIENYVIEYYYKNQLSMFANSRLNVKQKIEIVAYKLADECYDEFVLENWIRYFRIFINRFKKKRSS